MVSDAKQDFQQSQIAVVEKTTVVAEEEVVVTATGPTVEEDHHRVARYCLALNIYHESRSDSFAGQSAVADVVMNRVEDTYYPNTVCEVVKQTVKINNEQEIKIQYLETRIQLLESQLKDINRMEITQSRHESEIDTQAEKIETLFNLWNNKQ